MEYLGDSRSKRIGTNGDEDDDYLFINKDFQFVASVKL